MKLNIPFYKQKRKNECGPVALQMVLSYFGKSYSRKKLSSLIDSEKSGITWGIGLAKTSAQLGFKTEFYSTSLGFNSKNYELEFYKKNSDKVTITKRKISRLYKEALKFGAEIHEKSLSLKKILTKINNNCVSIVLLDWSRIKGTDKFQGHFVPIVGYDKKNVYVHNQGRKNPTPYLRIKRRIFEKARKSKGTDQDIIFIYKE